MAQLDIQVNLQLSDAQKRIEQLEKELAKANETAKDSEKAGKKGASGFLSLGNAIKGLGVISVITSAFNFFKEALLKNQKVADAFAAIMDTISTIVNTLVDIFISVTSEVGKSTNGFDALGKVLSGILTLAITPLKVAFSGIKLIINEVQLAWEKSPFGNKDQKVIKELTESISESKDALVEVGKNAVAAGKDIYNNFGEAASSVVKVVSGVVEKASKINVGAIYEQSKATIELKNNAKLAEAQLQGLVEKYDRQAEQLRQIRDNEQLSITERIEANNKLGKVLDEQEKAQIKLAQAKVASAAAELAQNKTNVDLQAALISAQNQVFAVQAQVAGLRSEQLVNEISLLKEQRDINKAIAENDNKLVIDKKKANAELIKDEILKLDAKKAIAKEEADLELKRLQDNIANTKAGTAARAEAEIVYSQKKQEIDIQLNQFEVDLATAKYNRELTKLEQLDSLNTSTYDIKAKALEDEQMLIQTAFDNGIIAETEYNAKVKAISEERIAIAIAEKERKASIQTAELDLLVGAANLAKEIFGKSKAVQAASIIAENAAGIGKIIINTNVANAKAAAQFPLTAGQPFVTINTISAALGIASSLAATKKALSGLGAGGSAGSAPNIQQGGSAPMQPQQAEAATTNLSSSTINALGNQAIKAYVVETDVTSNQQRIKAIQQRARFD
jgi:hypothetical protein